MRHRRPRAESSRERSCDPLPRDDHRVDDHASDHSHGDDDDDDDDDDGDSGIILSRARRERS